MNNKSPSLTVVIVAYGVEKLNLGALPVGVPVVIVHNDDLLQSGTDSAAETLHIYSDSNIGYGRAVNLGLKQVDTPRVLLLNPDAVLSDAHWSVLQTGGEEELVTVPMVDDTGKPMTSAFKYPTAAQVLWTATGAMRLVPRDSYRRKVFSKVLGSWGQDRRWSVAQPPGRYPLTDWWASAAVLALPTTLLKQVGGFDPGYFLYYEDTDLSTAIADVRPSAFLTIADTPPAIHAVGGSARSDQDHRLVASEQWKSARHFVAKRKGASWRAVGAVLSAASHGRKAEPN
jgi:N-acetylglucosaminyl-diphospho-decaprenol L-rhamnosyltransferase